MVMRLSYWLIAFSIEPPRIPCLASLGRGGPSWLPCVPHWGNTVFADLLLSNTLHTTRDVRQNVNSAELRVGCQLRKYTSPAHRPPDRLAAESDCQGLIVPISWIYRQNKSQGAKSVIGNWFWVWSKTNGFWKSQALKSQFGNRYLQDCWRHTSPSTHAITHWEKK